MRMNKRRSKIRSENERRSKRRVKLVQPLIQRRVGGVEKSDKMKRKRRVRRGAERVGKKQEDNGRRWWDNELGRRGKNERKKS